MNLNNIYQQIPAASYRVTPTAQSTNTNINQAMVSHQMKSNNNNNINNVMQNNTPSSLVDADKVIFKIESDHFSNSSGVYTATNNFKLNNNYTNQLVNNHSSNNSHDLKQFKIINNPNHISPVPMANNGIVQAQVQSQQQHQLVKEMTKVENSTIKSEKLPPQAVSAPITSNEDGDPSALNIYVNNVVCSYSTRCHLNLRRIAMEGMHVEYKKENGMVNMKLRKPYTTATMWSSGKVTCAGAKSEADAYSAARRFCRMLQKMQFKVKMTNFRVVNVLATCNMPFGVDIQKLAESYQKECSYEPELHPGATFKLFKIKATLKLFTTGSITLTAPSVLIAQEAINQIYPILMEFKRCFPAETPVGAPTIIKTELGISQQQQSIQQQKLYQQNFNSMSTIKHEPTIKSPVQTNISNLNFYNNPQSNLKPVTKTIGTPNIIPINSLNNNSTATSIHHQNTNVSQLSHLNNASKPLNTTFNVVKTPINTIQKANQLINSTNQVYQLNLPQTYHQIIPSNSIYTTNTSNPSSNTNPLFVPSLTSPLSTQAAPANILNTNINHTTSITNPSSHHQSAFNLSNHSSTSSNIQSIISSNSFSSNLGGSSLTQPSNGWYFDSLLVDNVDDFLP